MYKPKLENAPTHYHERTLELRIPARKPAPPAWRADVLRAIALLFTAAAILGVAALAFGCQSARVRAQIQQAQDQAAVKAAQVKAQNELAIARATAHGKLNDAKASAAPASHPWASLNLVIKHLRAPLETVCILSTVLLLVSIGVWFTQFRFLSKIAIPIFGVLAVGSFVDVITLPYAPWLLLAGCAGIVGFVVYEIIRKRSLKAGLQAVKVDVDSELYGNTPPSSLAPGPSPSQGTSDKGQMTPFSQWAARVESDLQQHFEQLLGLRAGTKSAPIVTTEPQK